jgi:hypothetical protein
MTDVFEFSTFTRDGLLYDFTDMTPEQAEEKKRKADEYAAEQLKKKELAAKEAAEKKAAAVPPAPKPAETPKTDVKPENNETKES